MLSKKLWNQKTFSFMIKPWEIKLVWKILRPTSVRIEQLKVVIHKEEDSVKNAKGSHSGARRENAENIPSHHNWFHWQALKLWDGDNQSITSCHLTCSKHPWTELVSAGEHSMTMVIFEIFHSISWDLQRLKYSWNVETRKEIFITVIIWHEF